MEAGQDGKNGHRVQSRVVKACALDNEFVTDHAHCLEEESVKVQQRTLRSVMLSCIVQVSSFARKIN